MYSVVDVQRRLLELGFDPGPADGVRGRMMISAVRQFQRVKKLEADGIVGPRTLAAMFGGQDQRKAQQIASTPPHLAPDATPWMDEAKRKMGLHEQRNNRSLWSWLRSDGGSVGDPSVNPWCGDFVETCIAKTLPDEILPNNPYWARDWADFGIPCPPVYGAVAVFSRGKGGHVGFVVRRDPKAKRLMILGGNQSNSVTEAWLSENRLLATRWPETALPHSGKVPTASSSGAKLSRNEA